jgi:hypothetical protein
MSDDNLDRDGFDRDDELRALLRSGDPARSLSPADPAALSHLLEDTMSADLEIRPVAPDDGNRATGTHGRNRLTWLVAAAAAAMIAGVGGFAIAGLSGDDSPPPQASDHRTTPPGTTPGTTAGAPVAGVTTQLTAKAPAGRCATPTPAMLAQYDQAFQGTVTAIDGGMVTLQATDVFNGEVGETVQVAAAPPDLQALQSTVNFQVGGTYLVSAFDGSVSTCPGFSGPASGEVQSLYTEAFVR